jgi:fructose-1-phosphate kinase PfkB-like protein
VKAGPHLVKVNAEEGAALLGRDIATLDDARDGAIEILRMTGGDGRIAIVTIGAEGAVVATGAEEILRGRLYTKGPYPVGSGDAFLAGFVTALDAGESPRQALCLALGAGTANAETPGAGRLDPERAKELASRAEVDQIAMPD